MHQHGAWPEHHSAIAIKVQYGPWGRDTGKVHDYTSLYHRPSWAPGWATKAHLASGQDSIKPTKEGDPTLAKMRQA